MTIEDVKVSPVITQFDDGRESNLRLYPYSMYTDELSASAWTALLFVQYRSVLSGVEHGENSGTVRHLCAGAVPELQLIGREKIL